MKIRMTFDFDQGDRLAISRQVGSEKPATRDELWFWINKVVRATLQDILDEYKERHRKQGG